MNPVKAAIDRRLENACLPESAYRLPERGPAPPKNASMPPEPRSRFRPVRRGIAVVVCVLLLLCAAGAIGVSALPEEARAHLAALFGTEDSRFDAIGTVCRNNGVIVTLDGMYASDNDLYVLFTVAREDGEPFAEDAAFVSFGDAKEDVFEVWAGCAGVGRGLVDPVAWGDPEAVYKDAPHLKEFHYQIKCSGTGLRDAAGETVTFTFRDIVAYWDGVHEDTILRGKWTLKAPIELSEEPAYARAGQVIPCGDVKVTVKELAFTPVSVSIRLSFDKKITYREIPGEDGMEMLLDGAPAEPGAPDPYDRCSDFKLTDIHGNTWPIDTSGVLIREDGSWHCSGLMEEAGPIPIEEMASVTLYGQTIPLEWLS